MAKAEPGLEWRTDELYAVDEAVRRLTFQRKLPAHLLIKPFRQVLVGIDGTPSSQTAVQWAGRVRKATKAKVSLVTVVPPNPGLDSHLELSKTLEALERESEKGAKRALEEAASILERDGAVAKGILRWGFPAFEIVKAARGLEADLVVLGSHGHGRMDRVLLGSVVDGVRNHVKGSVLIAKAAPGPGPVLIPVDGSAGSLAALRVGLFLARKWGAEALVFHVFEPPVYYDPEDAREEFQRIIARFELPSKARGVQYLLAIGHPAKQILSYVRDHQPRLVVVGSRGKGGLRSLVAGSVSNRVAHESPASVLIVKS